MGKAETIRAMNEWERFATKSKGRWIRCCGLPF
jgi:hypothetical protein